MNEKLIAQAQILLSILYTVGYFSILIMFMLGLARVPERFDNAFTGLLNLLSAAQLGIFAYWFQRQRPASTPDPATTASTTTIQTRTVPTGAAPIAPAPIPPTTGVTK